MKNNEHGDFPVLATDKHTGKQRKSMYDWRDELLPRSTVEGNVVWHAVLIWTALTQDALSHTEGKCKSVLITWVSQTERERNVRLCQHTSTPSDLHYRPATSFLSGQQQHWSCVSDMCLVAVQFFIWQHSVFIEVCFIVLHCVSLLFRLFTFIWKASPTRDVSESSKLSEELLYMSGKLIGPLPNQCVSD